MKNMKWMLLTIFIFFFVFAPLYLLNSLVMPDLLGLKQTYLHADQRANAIISQSQNITQK
jgi:hypothetical protein